MAFRFKLGEPIEKGFRRIGSEQIERARRQLSANLDAASEIHEARKCMKRIRALLRLARIGLGETVYRAESAHFRSIAASLSSARDRHVLLETIVKLMAQENENAAPASLARIKAAVLADHDREANDPAANMTGADAALEQALRRFRRLRLAPDSFTTLEQGLVRNYRKALERRAIACAENTGEAFHEWRKCVQTHWRHMALLSKAWPQLFSAQIEAARELSQILGDDHDLCMLAAKVSTLEASDLSAADAEEIGALIRARQTALRLAASPLGDVIFAERPKAHGRRIAAIWHGANAVKQESAETAEEPAAKRVRAKALAHARS
jgi:CHAD domain-containing protein